jgi:hypothetical protein
MQIPSSRSLNELASKKKDIFLNEYVGVYQSKKGTNMLRNYSISTINVSPSNISLATIIKKKIFGSSTTLDIDDKEKITKLFNSLNLKSKKFRKSDISAPVNFSHVTHLDKPVPIGKRYKLNYKA